MLLDLERAPAGERPRIALAEPVMPLLDFFGGASRARHVVQQIEEPPRLRRHFIEGAAQDFARQSVRGRDVLQRDFDMLDTFHFAPWPLVLVKQGDGADERQIFFLVAAKPGVFVREREPTGERIMHRQRLQKPLRVAVRLPQRGGADFAQVAFDGFFLALQLMDAPRLLARFVHRQREAAVGQFLVDFN